MDSLLPKPVIDKIAIVNTELALRALGYEVARVARLKV